MDYILKRSRRKTMELSINDDLVPVVKAPLLAKQSDIDFFVAKHEKWIEEKKKLKAEKQKRFSVSEADEKRLKKEALDYLSKRTEYYSKLMGLRPAGIKITSAKKRFGSCSAADSICYSWRLMLYPQEAIDYVVVHELAHIRYKNHGKDFYALIAKYLPDYREKEKILKKT